MASFFKATNTGVGFITHNDRKTFTIIEGAPGIFEVSGAFQAWVARVGAVELTPTELQAYLNDKITQIMIGMLAKTDWEVIAENDSAPSKKHLMKSQTKVQRAAIWDWHDAKQTEINTAATNAALAAIDLTPPNV